MAATRMSPLGMVALPSTCRKDAVPAMEKRGERPASVCVCVCLACACSVSACFPSRRPRWPGTPKGKKTESIAAHWLARRPSEDSGSNHNEWTVSLALQI